MSPEPTRPKSLILENLPNLLGRNPTEASPSPPSPASSLLPDIEEIRVSPCIAKKGYLNILEEKTKGWKKRWVIVRRPYVFVFRDERDPCERALVNLATARTEYNAVTPVLGGAGVKVANSFSIVTSHRGYLVQAASDRDLHDWLYAINPLLAGQIKSKTARTRPADQPPQSNGQPASGQD